MRRRLTLLTFLALGITAAVIGCTGTVFPDDAHVWGNFNTCLRKVRDTCHHSDIDGGACFASVTGTTQLSIALRGDRSTLLLARPPLSTVGGTQVLERFEVTHDVTASSGLSRAVCGCEVNIRETIRGELLAEAPETSLCSSPDGGTSDGGSTDGGADMGCTPRDGGSHVPTDWLSGASRALDFEEPYPAIRGTIVNEIQATNGDECLCNGCVIEYEFTGFQ